VQEEGSNDERFAFAMVEEEQAGLDCCCCWDGETFPVDGEGCTDPCLR